MNQLLAEACGASQPLPARKLAPFQGADGADALQEVGSNGVHSPQQ